MYNESAGAIILAMLFALKKDLILSPEMLESKEPETKKEICLKEEDKIIPISINVRLIDIVTKKTKLESKGDWWQ